MAARKQRRKSLEQEDLAAVVAEMIHSPITRANLSFLTATDAGVINQSTIEDTSRESNTVVPQTVVDLAVVDTTMVDPATDVSSTKTLPKVHLCRTVQDGHSPSEQGLYMMLWSIGTPVREDIRLVQVSLSRLAPRAGMTIKNLQLMLRRLEEKKTIALAKQFSYASKAANAYHVYSYKAILQRRKDAGLEYVTRNKGVQFIKTEEARAILHARQEEDNRLFGDAAMEVTTIVDLETTIVKTSETTMVKTSETTIVDSAHIIEQEVREQTSSATGALIRRLRREIEHADDAAVERLLDECYKRAPDATQAEIEHFVSQKLALMRQMQNIRNPMGFLLTSVPPCFQGEAFRQFRDEQRRRLEMEEAERAAAAAETARYRAVLEDPEASEQGKREARWFLGISAEIPW